MRKQNLLTSFYLFLLLILATGQFALAQSNGTFTVVKGDVQVTSANGTTEKAKVGKKVNPADVITAGAESRAKIVMADKNVINISPETKMALEKYVFDPSTDNKQVTLNVVYGKVRATVEQKYDGEKNKFHIKTPAAVAGVRGTDFLTSYSAKTRETKIITFEGKVAVGLPGPGGQIMNPVFVTPGQMTTTTQGAPPTPPVSVPAEEFNKVKSDSQAEPAKNETTKTDSAAPQKEEKGEDKKEDAAKSDAAADDGSKKDAAQNEEPKSEEPKKEDTAKKDEPKKEDTAKKEESAKRDEPAKKETAQTEEPPKKDSAKKDEPRKEERQDAKSPEKRDEPKQAENNRGGDKSGKPSAPKTDQSPSSDGKREPASTAARGPSSTSGGREVGKVPPPPPGTMMLDRSDLAPTISSGVPTFQSQTNVNTNFTPYVPPAATTQQHINQVKEIISNTNTQSKVNIIIKRAP